MFENLRDNMKDAVNGIQEKYNGLADSVDKLNQDLLEIRDLFVSVKNLVVSIFSFVGHETAVLLLCTFLFLFVVNMIPFLFFDKKGRYYIGVGFGIFLSFFFGYTALALAKYILIMFFPIIVEFLLIKIFKLTGKSFGTLLKNGLLALKKGGMALLRKVFGKTEKIENNEKPVLKK